MGSNVAVSQIDFDDFEVLHQTVKGTSIDVVQLGPGKMTGRLTHLAIGSVTLSSGSFSRSLRARGVIPHKIWGIGTPLLAPFRSNNVEMLPGDLGISAPGHEFYSHHPHANDFMTTFITEDELFGYLDSQPGAVDLIQRQSSALASNRNVAAARVTRLTMLRDELVKHGPTMPPATVEFFKRSLIELLVWPVIGNVSYRGPQLHMGAIKLVREVDHFADAVKRPIHVSELCERFKVSSRTLHRAFHDVIGVPVINFLRAKRLCYVHSALLMDGHIQIADIAHNHGFLQLGKFASDYRHLFGEKPSQTLRRANHHHS